MKIAILSTAGAWLKPFVKAFQSLSHESKMIVIDAQAGSTADSVLAELKNFKPNFCVTENFYVFDTLHKDVSLPLEAYLQSEKIPTAVWFVDSPRGSGSTLNTERWRRGYLPEWMSFFCVDTYDLKDFQTKGLPSAYLPICIDSDLESFKPNSSLTPLFKSNISFVGKIHTQAESPLKSNDEIEMFFLNNFLNYLMSAIEGDQRQLNAFNERAFNDLKIKVHRHFYEFFHSTALTAEDYSRQWTHLFARLNETLPSGLIDLPSILEGHLHFHYSYSQLLKNLLRFLAHDMKIYGSENWAKMLNVGSQTPRSLSQEELLNCFHASSINLNFTKWHLKGAVHERIPLIFAAGGFPLTDFREELYSFFDKTEVASFTGIDEAESLATYFLKHETERLSMIERGRQKVFAAHTFRHRAQTLIDTMVQHWGLAK
jgi:spore maturation protein CgeB